MRRGAGSALVAAALALATACTSPGSARPVATSSPLRPTPGATPSATAAPTPAPPALRLETVVEVASPVWAGSLPGDPTRLLLAQRAGLVQLLDAEGRREQVVLDLRGQVSTGNEQGLLSMALHPGYPRVPRLYVHYTDREGDTRVVAYTVVAGRAVRPQPLLTIPQPFPNNNGGHLLFDRTGMLLVSTGDGGNAGDPQGVAQDPSSFLGKILRLHPVTGRPAPDNPFPENRYVWAVGLRNPWRMTMDAAGFLYVGDAGQKSAEELDLVPPQYQRGANFGWSVYDGEEPFRPDRGFTPGPLIAPALTRPHTLGTCLITVGPVYLGTATPSLRGSLLFGDYCQGRLLASRRTGPLSLSEPLDLDVRAEGLVGFGVDAAGEVLVLTVDRVSRLVPGE